MGAGSRHNSPHRSAGAGTSLALQELFLDSISRYRPDTDSIKQPSNVPRFLCLSAPTQPAQIQQIKNENEGVRWAEKMDSRDRMGWRWCTSCSRSRLLRGVLRLWHDGVLAPELGVDALEVVRARPEVLKRPTGLIRRRVVVLLPNLSPNQLCQWGAEAHELHAHLQRVDKLLAGDNLHAREAVEEVHLSLDLGRVPDDADAPVARSAPATKREHSDAPAAHVRGRDGREQRRESAVERRGVHVPAPLRALHRRLDVLLVVRLRERDERLLQRLVRQRLCRRQREQLFCIICRDRRVLWSGWVRNEVVVHLGKSSTSCKKGDLTR
jgi:hypothetical protein